MGLKGIEELFPEIFSLTLGETVRNWYQSLDPQMINTLESITKEFLSQLSLQH